MVLTWKDKRMTLEKYLNRWDTAEIFKKFEFEKGIKGGIENLYEHYLDTYGKEIEEH